MNSSEHRPTAPLTISELKIWAMTIFRILTVIILSLLLVKSNILICAAAHLAPAFNLPFIKQGFLSGSQIFMCIQCLASLIFVVVYSAFVYFACVDNAWVNEYFYDLVSQELSMLPRFLIFLAISIAFSLLYSVMVCVSLLAVLPVVKVVIGFVELIFVGVVSLIISAWALHKLCLFIFCWGPTSNKASVGRFAIQSFRFAQLLVILSLLALFLFTISPVIPIIASKIPAFLFLHNTSYTIIITAISSVFSILLFFAGNISEMALKDMLGELKLPDMLGEVSRDSTKSDEFNSDCELNKRLGSTFDSRSINNTGTSSINSERRPPS